MPNISLCSAKAGWTCFSCRPNILLLFGQCRPNVFILFGHYHTLLRKIPIYGYATRVDDVFKINTLSLHLLNLII